MVLQQVDEGTPQMEQEQIWELSCKIKDNSSPETVLPNKINPQTGQRMINLDVALRMLKILEMEIEKLLFLTMEQMKASQSKIIRPVNTNAPTNTIKSFAERILRKKQ